MERSPIQYASQAIGFQLKQGQQEALEHCQLANRLWQIRNIPGTTILCRCSIFERELDCDCHLAIDKPDEGPVDLVTSKGDTKRVPW